MDNQHKLIKGYRDLSQEEIDLMNSIKDKGRELLELQAKLVEHLREEELKKRMVAQVSPDGSVEQGKYERFQEAEPLRWASIGKTHVQEAIMALVRAVAQPDGGV